MGKSKAKYKKKLAAAEEFYRDAIEQQAAELMADILRQSREIEILKIENNRLEKHIAICEKAHSYKDNVITYLETRD